MYCYRLTTSQRAGTKLAIHAFCNGRWKRTAYRAYGKFHIFHWSSRKNIRNVLAESLLRVAYCIYPTLGVLIDFGTFWVKVIQTTARGGRLCKSVKPVSQSGIIMIETSS